MTDKKPLVTRGKTLTGTVTKFKAAKTATIEWERTLLNRKYERNYKKTSKVHAHVPEDMDIHEGDKVEIEECRPISKSKHFIVTKKL